MGRLYWYKHGVESVFVRIGSCFPEPINARMLATWLSYPDLVAPGGPLRAGGEGRLQRDLGRVEQPAHDMVGRTTADSIGWQPRDSADPFAGQLAGKVSGDPVEERYKGGGLSPRSTIPAERAVARQAVREISRNSACFRPDRVGKRAEDPVHIGLLDDQRRRERDDVAGGADQHAAHRSSAGRRRSPVGRLARARLQLDARRSAR